MHAPLGVRDRLLGGFYSSRSETGPTARKEIHSRAECAKSSFRSSLRDLSRVASSWSLARNRRETLHGAHDSGNADTRLTHIGNDAPDRPEKPVAVSGRRWRSCVGGWRYQIRRAGPDEFMPWPTMIQWGWGFTKSVTFWRCSVEEGTRKKESSQVALRTFLDHLGNFIARWR